jgi:hypothetical protein
MISITVESYGLIEHYLVINAAKYFSLRSINFGDIDGQTLQKIVFFCIFAYVLYVACWTLHNDNNRDV